MNNQPIEDFYNDFFGGQTELAINERVYQLFKRMRNLHLNTKSHVLELGCAIGTLTFLLSKMVKKGKIEAVDLSPKSIAFAKSKIKNQNIAFYAADIVNYTPIHRDYDFITLFDVIEHIPIERHDELFKNISQIADEKTQILISIPNPDYIEYDQENHPEVLQIIDQPLPLSLIAENLEKNGLQITFFETYSVWIENDYQFFIIRKKREFQEKEIAHQRGTLQKINAKIKRAWIDLKYRYR